MCTRFFCRTVFVGFVDASYGICRPIPRPLAHRTVRFPFSIFDPLAAPWIAWIVIADFFFCQRKWLSVVGRNLFYFFSVCALCPFAINTFLNANEATYDSFVLTESNMTCAMVAFFTCSFNLFCRSATCAQRNIYGTCRWFWVNCARSY